MQIQERAYLIKQARLNAKLTQVELARRIGSPQAFISQVELGLKPVGNKTVCKIADALGVSVDDLLGPTKTPDHDIAALEQETPQEKVARAFALLAITRARLRSRFMP